MIDVVCSAALNGAAPPLSPPGITASRPISFMIIGLDEAGRPHASQFAEEDPAAIHHAATAMAMVCVSADEPTLQRLAEQLPAGKIFNSGKAFVPFVKRSLYDQLVDNLPEGVEPPSQPSKAVTSSQSTSADTISAGPISRSSLPHDWSKIRVGSVVLASLTADDGWWPAVITEAKSDEFFALEWKDYSDWEPFLRKREQLALLHPSFGS